MATIGNGEVAVVAAATGDHRGRNRGGDFGGDAFGEEYKR